MMTAGPGNGARHTVDAQGRSGTPESVRDTLRNLRVLLAVPAIGFIVILVYGLGVPRSSIASVISVGLMTGAAALVAGALLGFLFGIPRTLQQAEPRSATPGTEEESARSQGYGVNTNLEQISDWLTKILVGVGLTQIPAIGEALGELIDQIGADLGDNRSIAGAILVYFVSSGFLIGYVLTRTVLARTFTLFDRRVLESRITQLEERNEEITREVQALHLVERLLAGSQDGPLSSDGARRDEETSQQLTEFLTGASQSIIRQVFDQAWAARSENWRQNKTKMARTIPIFQALIAVDKDRQYHRNHGELGFALKDKEPPDWATAKKELDEAIELRDRIGDSDQPYYRLYEYNRAMCLIHLDPKKESMEPTDEPLRRQIRDDISVAARERWLYERMNEDSTFTSWLRRNNLRLDNVGVG